MRRWVWLAMLLLLTLPARAPADEIDATLRRDLAAIVHDDDRSAGTPGAQRTADFSARRLAEATGLPVWRQQFLMVVPEVAECSATALTADGADAGSVPLAPLQPMAGQNAALPGKEATADVIYAGNGTLAELGGKTIAGNWVTLEIESDSTAWQTIASLGARGVIFLGSPQARAQALLDKSTSTPVGLPRFFCDDPAAVAALRAQTLRKLKIHVHVRWTEKPVENLLCLIPGRQTTADLAYARADWTRQLVVLQARLDASSQVLGRAPGAEQATSVATVLRLADGLAKAPDRCTVLVALTAGDEWQFRGTRMLEDLLHPDLKSMVKAVHELEQAQAKLKTAQGTATLLIANLEKLSSSNLAGLKDPAANRVIRDQLSREASRVEEQLEHARLLQSKPDIATLAAQKDTLVSATGALLGHRDMDPANLAAIAKSAADALPVWRRERQRLEQDLAAHANWSEIRHALGERQPLVHFDVSLTSHGEQFGFFARSSYFWQYDQTGKMSEYGTALRRYWTDAYGKDASAAAGKFHADSTTGQYPFNTFFPVRRAFSSDAVLVRGTPAGCFATEFDNSGVVDTPGDRLDRLDLAALAAQVRDLEILLLGSSSAKPGALTDPRFYGRSELSNIVTNQPLRLLERTLGETTPRLAAAEVLVGGEHEKDRDYRANSGSLQATRRFDWYLSHPFIGINDDDASVVLTSLQRWDFRVHALDFDPDGMPIRCIVANTNDQRGIVHRFTPDANRPQRAMLFDCRRLSLFNLFDPRYMEYLDKIDLLDARRLDKAQFSNVFVRDGIGAVFMPPDLRWQLLVSKGDVTNRMILINAPPPPAASGAKASTDPESGEAKGFTTADLAQIGPLSWRTATDFYALNTRRKANLEQYGISSEVVSDLQSRTKTLLDAGAAARERQDYVAWMANAAGAWSLQEQAYATLITTSNGIIKGVIFLLLGIIPFSYFLERLLIGATNVYKQIGWFALIFTVMTIALLGHPAFRISSAPLMILLAFLILILSSTVIYILWGKFEEEIARLRGAGSSAHSTSLRRGAVFGAAIRLGLSNMRRRGMRTTLTLITLVLLTFTLLCFTSVRDTLMLTPRLVDDAPRQAPPGILLRQRGWKALPGPALQMAREIANGLGGRTENGADTGIISQRWWYSSEKPEGVWRLPVSPVNPSEAPATIDTTFYASGLVGIDPMEQYFQAADLTKLLPGWEHLAAGETVCFLPDDARALGVGTRVKILGETLVVAGFYNPDKVQTQLKHLTGDELMPTDPSSNAQAGPGSTQSTPPEEIATLPEMTYRFLPARSVALIPTAVARRIGARLTSVMVRPATDAATRPATAPDATASILTLAEDLSRRSAFTVYVSDGVHPIVSINSVESTRPQNLQKVLVPLIIAGVIVLNTMLGAVAERTREIHVYTSVGLAPSHVGMLFLAEAAALGTLGVVFGYIFGQALATFLSHTHLISGIDLNYSSMAAVFTMALVLGLVMLSSLWPARAATRVAAPSLQRDWKLPAPQGDLLKVELPFTVNQTAAKGVCAFLEEYMLTASQMGGAGGGRFTADHIRAFECPVSSVQFPETPAPSSAAVSPPQLETGNRTLDTRPTLDTVVRGIACRIWLAPYDLGVIQSFWLAIHPTPDAHVFEVRLTILREAGNPGTWFRLNRPFLVEIRKQFLLWRSVRTEQIEDYMTRSRTMFEQAEPKLPPEK